MGFFLLLLSFRFQCEFNKFIKITGGGHNSRQFAARNYRCRLRHTKIVFDIMALRLDLRLLELIYFRRDEALCAVDQRAQPAASKRRAQNNLSKSSLNTTRSLVIAFAS